MDRILFVHNGALGDFLCAWPGMFSIISHYRSKNPETQILFSGRGFGLAWLEPLGVRKAGPELLYDVERMYLSAEPPAWLESSKVFWFCLKEAVSKVVHPNLISLPILDFREMGNSGGSGGPLVIANLARQLQNRGIIWQENWLAAWRNRFGKWEGEKSRQVGLIPGSGHMAKSWPLENFETLAQALDDAGYDPVYLLGPVESERGICPSGARAEYPSPPSELAARMMGMRAVIACDGGPSHLASHHGVPGLVLFGPVNWRTWAPENLDLILPPADAVCPSPVDDPKDIDTSQPSCMGLITVEDVLEAFFRLTGRHASAN